MPPLAGTRPDVRRVMAIGNETEADKRSLVGSGQAERPDRSRRYRRANKPPYG